MKPATYYVPSALVAPLKTIASAYGQMHANDKMDNLDVKAKGVDDVINVSASFIVYRALVWTLPLSGGGGGHAFRASSRFSILHVPLFSASIVQCIGLGLFGICCVFCLFGI